MTRSIGGRAPHRSIPPFEFATCYERNEQRDSVTAAITKALAARRRSTRVARVQFPGRRAMTRRLASGHICATNAAARRRSCSLCTDSSTRRARVASQRRGLPHLTYAASRHLRSLAIYDACGTPRYLQRYLRMRRLCACVAMTTGQSVPCATGALPWWVDAAVIVVCAVFCLLSSTRDTQVTHFEWTFCIRLHQFRQSLF